MRARRLFAVMVLMLTVGACIQDQEMNPVNEGRYEVPGPGFEVPDFEPNPPPNIIITTLNITRKFSPAEHFEVPLDFNKDGNNEVWLLGKVYDDDTYGHLHAVMLIGVDGNEIMAETPQKICNSDLAFYPIKPVFQNESIGAATPWERFGLFYVLADYMDCFSVNRYIPFRETHYYGVRMTMEGREHYGWIEISSSGPSRLGYPDCATEWTVKRIAYNANPGQDIGFY